MSANLFSLKTIALLVAASALLHIFAFIPGGLNSDAGIMFGVGIIYLLLAIGLGRNWRWVAWLAFLAMMFGAVAAYVVSGGGTALFDGWYLTIAMINLAAAILLFVCLWRSDQRSQQA